MPPKFDARDYLAVLALAIFGGAMWLDHMGFLADWAKESVSTIPTVVLGYYFVDSFKRGVAPSPSGQSAPPPTVEPPAPAADRTA